MDSIDRNVFVVHGRNLAAKRSVFDLLRSAGLKPIEWNQAVKWTGKGGPTILEILDAAFERAQAVIVLITGDDEARLRHAFHDLKRDDHWEHALVPQARPNVLFEAGLAYGRQPNRTIFVELPPVRPFTDIAGVHILQLDGSPTTRDALLSRLADAGCAVKRDDGAWLTAGDFDKALVASTAPGADEPGWWRAEVSDDRHRLEVELVRWPDSKHWFWVRLRLAAVDPQKNPLNGTVVFKLDDSYSDPKQEIPVRFGEALLVVSTEAPYKLSASCGTSKLKFNLGDFQGVPWAD